MKAMGNERSYILVRVVPKGLSFGQVGLGGSWGATAPAEPAKTFLFGNSHVRSCDLTYLMCPTC